MESIDRAGRKIGEGVEDIKRTGSRAAEEARETGRRLRHGLRADIDNLLDELDDILRNDGARDIEDLRARLAAHVENARSTLEQASGTATDAVSDAIGCAEDYVRTRPWHAVGTVAGVAFLLGLIAARR